MPLRGLLRRYRVRSRARRFYEFSFPIVCREASSSHNITRVIARKNHAALALRTVSELYRLASRPLTGFPFFFSFAPVSRTWSDPRNKKRLPVLLSISRDKRQKKETEERTKLRAISLAHNVTQCERGLFVLWIV